ncbi:hypothetical protein GQ53DRAFT_874109 [Thozetella sp. PMI_491]|nr:hypothetical protein GQ53DRAFT_874109 [Thozetella sp. PMI_491]
MDRDPPKCAPEDQIIMPDDQMDKSVDGASSKPSQVTLSDMQMGVLTWSEYSRAIREAALASRILEAEFQVQDFGSWSEDKVDEAHMREVIVGLADSEAEAILSRDLEKRRNAGYISYHGHVRALPDVYVDDINPETAILALEMGWTRIADIPVLRDHLPVSYTAWVTSNRSRSDLHPDSLPQFDVSARTPGFMIDLTEIGDDVVALNLKSAASLRYGETSTGSKNEADIPPSSGAWPKTSENNASDNSCGLEADLEATQSHHSSENQSVEESSNEDMETENASSAAKGFYHPKRLADDSPVMDTRPLKRFKDSKKFDADKDKRVERSEGFLPTKNFFEFHEMVNSARAAGRCPSMNYQESLYSGATPRPTTAPEPDTSPPTRSSGAVASTPIAQPKAAHQADTEILEKVRDVVRDLLELGRSAHEIVETIKPKFSMLNVEDWESFVVDVENEAVVDRLAGSDRRNRCRRGLWPGLLDSEAGVDA